MNRRNKLSPTVAPESRERLERDTRAYFETLSPKVRKEESDLAIALGKGLGDVDLEL